MKATIVLNSDVSVDIKGEYLVGVDGGTWQIIKQGKKPDLIVGDFDSYRDGPLDAEYIELNIDKDLTDSETAINELITRGFNEIDIYGIEGGRLDHIYSNIMLLVFAGRQGVKVRAILGNGVAVYYQKGLNYIEANEGDYVSIFPYAETKVITSEKLKFPLNNLNLTVPSNVSGLSNVALKCNPSINVLEGDGILFVINKKYV